MLKSRTPVYNTGSPSTKYEHQRTSPSVTRVVICLSRAFFSTDQEKRDTANVPIACRVTKTSLARVSSGSYRPELNLLRESPRQVLSRPTVRRFVRATVEPVLSGHPLFP